MLVWVIRQSWQPLLASPKLPKIHCVVPALVKSVWHESTSPGAETQQEHIVTSSTKRSSYGFIHQVQQICSTKHSYYIVLSNPYYIVLSNPYYIGNGGLSEVRRDSLIAFQQFNSCQIRKYLTVLETTQGRWRGHVREWRHGCSQVKQVHLCLSHPRNMQTVQTQKLCRQTRLIHLCASQSL